MALYLRSLTGFSHAFFLPSVTRTARADNAVQTGFAFRGSTLLRGRALPPPACAGERGVLCALQGEPRVRAGQPFALQHRAGSSSSREIASRSFKYLARGPL